MSPRSNISCSACRSQYDEGEWQALDLTDRVEPVEAARLVLGWSPLHCVEVRACRTCGHGIARRRAAAAA